MDASNAFTRGILVVVGILTVCLVVLLAIVHCLLKLRRIYRTSTPDLMYEELPGASKAFARVSAKSKSGVESGSV